MPRFPQYEAKETIGQPRVSTQLAVIERTGAGATGVLLSKAAGAIGEIVQQWQKSQDTMQYTTFKAKLETSIAKQKNLAQNDPDPNNVAAHQQALIDLKKEALEGFSNKELARASGIEMDKEISIASIEIGNAFKKKQLFQNSVDLNSAIDSMITQKITAPTDALAETKQSEIDALILSNFAAGNITLPQAKQFKKKARIGEVEQSLWADPEGTRAALEVTKDGKYVNYDLTGEERSNYIKNASDLIETRKKIAEKEADDTSTETSISLATSLVDDKLTPEEIQSAIQDGIIDGKDAEVFQKALIKTKRPKKAKRQAAEVYLNALDDVLSDKVKAKDIIQKATVEYTRGNITPDAYSYFIKQAQKKLERERNDLPGWDPLTKVFRATLSFFREFARSQNLNVDETAAQMSSEMIESGNIDNEEVIKNEADKIAVNKMIELRPSTQALDGMPNSVISAESDLQVLDTGKSAVKPTHIWKDGKLIKVK